VVADFTGISPEKSIYFFEAGKDFQRMNPAANPGACNNLFDRKITFPAIFSLPLP
jgi:hypothetical protein